MLHIFCFLDHKEAIRDIKNVAAEGRKWYVCDFNLATPMANLANPTAVTNIHYISAIIYLLRF